MLTRFASAIFGIVLGFAIAPAHAADDIDAKAQVCAACHGNKGIPTDPKTIPVIWGQQESYLMKQLRDFRNGERPSAVMAPIAQGLAEGGMSGTGKLVQLTEPFSTPERSSGPSCSNHFFVVACCSGGCPRFRRRRPADPRPSAPRRSKLPRR